MGTQLVMASCRRLRPIHVNACEVDIEREMPCMGARQAGATDGTAVPWLSGQEV